MNYSVERTKMVRR